MLIQIHCLSQVFYRQWLSWTRWSECDVTCGDGQRERTRECSTEPAGYEPCEGNSTHSRPCSVFCPGEVIRTTRSSYLEGSYFILISSFYPHSVQIQTASHVLVSSSWQNYVQVLPIKEHREASDYIWLTQWSKVCVTQIATQLIAPAPPHHTLTAPTVNALPQPTPHVSSPANPVWLSLTSSCHLTTILTLN